MHAYYRPVIESDMWPIQLCHHQYKWYWFTFPVTDRKWRVQMI